MSEPLSFGERLKAMKKEEEAEKAAREKEEAKNAKRKELEKKLAEVREKKAIKQFYELDAFIKILDAYEAKSKKPNLKIINELSKKYTNNAFKHKNLKDPELRKKVIAEAEKIKAEISKSIRKAENI